MKHYMRSINRTKNEGHTSCGMVIVLDKKGDEKVTPFRTEVSCKSCIKCLESVGLRPKFIGTVNMATFNKSVRIDENCRKQKRLKMEKKRKAKQVDSPFAVLSTLK